MTRGGDASGGAAERPALDRSDRAGDHGGADDVAVPGEDEGSFVTTGKVGEKRGRIRQMDMDEVGSGSTNLARHLGAYGRGAHTKQAGKPRHAHAVDHLIAMTAGIIGNEDANGDRAAELAA